MPLLAEALLHGNEITHYHYATVGARIVDLDRSSLRELEDALLQSAGRTLPSNHTVFGITAPDGHSLYIKFKNEIAIFGLTVEVHGGQ